MKLDSGKPADSTCKISFKGINHSTSEPVNRHIELKAPNEPVHIGRASRRHPDRGSPASHNALYNSAVVSRDHAIIYFEDMKVKLLDMSSTHGTFVNGQKLLPQQPQQLVVGDCVTLGNDVKATTGQNHKSVSFEIEYIFHQQDRTYVNEGSAEELGIDDDAQARLLSLSPYHEFGPDDGESCKHNPVSHVSSSSNKTTRSTPVFCVPSDSDDISEGSESEWYERFEVRKRHQWNSDQEVAVDDSAPTTSSTKQPTSPKSNAEPSLLASVVSMQDALEDPAPHLAAELFEDYSLCVCHDEGQQFISKVATSNGARPAQPAALVNSTSSPSHPRTFSTTNGIDTSRERLSIANLLSSPSACSHNTSGPPTSQIRSSSLGSAIGPAVESEYKEPYSNSDQATKNQNGVADIRSLPHSLSQPITQGRKRQFSLDEEKDDDDKHKEEQGLKNSSSYPPVIQKDFQQDTVEPPQKKLCLSPESTRSTSRSNFAQSLPRKQRDLAYQDTVSSFTSFALGTVLGGMAMFGGLIALPESFFSS